MLSRRRRQIEIDLRRPQQEGSGEFEGNRNCFLCHYLHILPFSRCRDCELPGANQCPTLKAGWFLVLLTAATGIVSHYIGGPVARTAFIMTALVTVALLLVINVHSNREARSHRQLLQLHQELAEQHVFLKDLSPLDSLEECLEHVVDSAAARLRCRRVSVMLADDDYQYLYIGAARGVPEEVIRETRIPIGQEVAGGVFLQDDAVHVTDAEKERGKAALSIDSTAYMSGPLLLSGIRWGSVRLGVLSVTEPIGRHDFSIDDQFSFSNICQAAAVAIYNRKAVARIRQNQMEFLETLVNVIEARDSYTRGHSERVSLYAAAIGRRLSLAEGVLNCLQVASRLHDIGKIGIPDAVLRKPGDLTQDEWEIIRRHPRIAAEMLSQASVVSYAVEAIHCHHERLDGSGYPRGLIGPEIPLAARMIGPADAFDAMTSVRPYRDPFSVADALAELKRCSGTKFDPACVEALIQAIEAGEATGLLPAHVGMAAPVAAPAHVM